MSHCVADLQNYLLTGPSHVAAESVEVHARVLLEEVRQITCSLRFFIFLHRNFVDGSELAQLPYIKINVLFLITL